MHLFNLSFILLLLINTLVLCDSAEVDLQQPMQSHSISWLSSYTFTSAGKDCTRPHGKVSAFLILVDILSKT